MEQNDIYKIAITKIPKLGPKLIRNLVSYCGSVEAVFKEPRKNLLKIPSIGRITANHIFNARCLTDAERVVEDLIKREIHFSFYLDEDYPVRLKNYLDAPPIFFFKGKNTLNKKRTVAIVGTRTPSNYGKIFCNKIIEAFGELDLVVISGLAYGIDTIAHTKSLEENISTIGILGHGFPTIYPEQNRKLAIRMMETGGLFTEFHVNQKIDPRQFPQRNRVIAMLSDAVIVVESKEKGGSMITADFANQYHKDVFALPGRSNDKFSAGCNFLIKNHMAALIETGEDVTKFMGWDQTLKPKQKQLFIELNPKEKTVMEILETQSEIELDKLHYLSSFQVSELSAILLKLEFEGLVKTLPGKKYVSV